MSKRELKLYLEDILTSINNIESYIQGFTYEVFAQDQRTIDAVVRNLEIIGEAARNLSSRIITKYPEVPWKQMIGMRNKALHEYFGIDVEILWKTVKEDIPPLKEQIKGLAELS